MSYAVFGTPPDPAPTYCPACGDTEHGPDNDCALATAWRRIRDLEAPIKMILHCPACHLQHIDAPEWERDPHDMEQGQIQKWKNPPHRSHLCRPEHGGCGHIWRPADVATEGVAAIETKGKADSPAPDVRLSDQPTPGLAEHLASLHVRIVELEDQLETAQVAPKHGDEPEAWKRLQALRNPYSDQVSAHAWDQAIIAAMRIILVAPTTTDDKRKPLGWLWRGKGVQRPIWRLMDNPDMITEMIDHGGFEIKAVYE